MKFSIFKLQGINISKDFFCGFCLRTNEEAPRSFKDEEYAQINSIVKIRSIFMPRVFVESLVK